METKRLIARLDIKGSNVIKGKQMEGLRVVGSVGDVAMRHYQSGVDEIILMDSVASLYGQDALFDAIRVATDGIFLPITAGGGVKSSSDAAKFIESGADRVAVNSAALQNRTLIGEIAERFGAQAVVVSIEARRVAAGRWNCFFESGRENSGVDVLDWISSLSPELVGEVLLTSVDSDGMAKGIDEPLIRAVNEISKIPVIYSGGASNLHDFATALSFSSVSGIATGLALHNRTIDVRSLKHELTSMGFQVRHQE